MRSAGWIWAQPTRPRAGRRTPPQPMRNRARWTGRTPGCLRLPRLNQAMNPKGQHDDRAVARRRPARSGVRVLLGHRDFMRSSRRVRLPTCSSSSRGCSTGSARSPTGTGSPHGSGWRFSSCSCGRSCVRAEPRQQSRGSCAVSPLAEVSFDTVAHVVASLHDGPRSVAVGVLSLLPVIRDRRCWITSARGDSWSTSSASSSEEAEAAARWPPVHDVDGHRDVADGRLRHARVGIARRRLRAGPALGGSRSRDRVGPSRSPPGVLRGVRDAGHPGAGWWDLCCPSVPPCWQCPHRRCSPVSSPASWATRSDWFTRQPPLRRVRWA